MRPLSLPFRPQKAAFAALTLLVFGLALPSEGKAGSDPNLQQRIQQFLYQPAPEDLIIRQEEAGDADKGAGKQAPKGAAKGAKN